MTEKSLSYRNCDKMIVVEHLSAGYGRKVILSDISLILPSSSLVAVIGRNGTGKSTLIRTLAGLLPPLSGKTSIGGKDIYRMTAVERARLCAFVGTEKIRVPALNCHDLVALGRAPYTGWRGSLTEEDEIAVDRALSLVEMQGFSERYLDSMSDGECQMVSVARAIAQDTPVILLDEPTAFLDFPNRRKTAALLKSIAGQGKTIIYSTHDIDIAMSFSDLVLLVSEDGVLLAPADSPVLRNRMERAFSSGV